MPESVDEVVYPIAEDDHPGDGGDPVPLPRPGPAQRLHALNRRSKIQRVQFW